MLAYVFWHWPRPGVEARAYELAQVAFHAGLRGAPPAGLVGSASLALSGAPWANAGGPAYEDWYLLRDAAALDPLNDAAVSAAHRGRHDAAAALAGGGTAGLYALRFGTGPSHPAAAWFAKPIGATHDDVWRAIVPLVSARQGALWMRRMVLGPSPEFCLQTATPGPLPAGYDPIRVTLRQLG